MTPLGSLARKIVLLTLAAGAFLFLPPRSWAQPATDDGALQDFFQALLRKDTQTAQQILSAHTNLARVPASRYLGKLPLLVAASKGQLEIVDQLLKLGADVNAEGDTWDTGNHRFTALEISVWYNQPAVCQRLLEARPNVNHQSNSEGSALHLACTHRRDEMARWLLDHGANPLLPRRNAYRQETPLALNILNGDGELVPRMLQMAGTNATGFLNTNGTALLRVAATRGKLTAVEALLQAGVSPAAVRPDEPPLLQAVALAAAPKPEAFLGVRDALRTHGAVYDIFAVTGFGDLATARQRLSTNPNLSTARDGAGATPLHWAVQADQLTLTSFWLEAGASANTTNLAGQTPVHLAAAAGLAAQLDLLLAAHPALDVRDAKGRTPLDAAMQAERTETIRQLMAEQNVVPPKDRGRAITLHEAAASGNIVVLAALTGSANVDARNELGLTPFHLAIQKGQLGAAALLVDRGANVNATDPAGNTALHQIVGNWSFSIAGRPSTRWLAQRNQDPRQATYLRYLAASEDEDGWPRYTLQAVGFLLACGADVSITNQAGRTPMQLLLDSKTAASESEQGEILKLFGGAGDNIDRRDAAGNTALHRAMQAEDGTDLDALVALIAGGADVNATNAAGQTPLHLAVEKLNSWGLDESSPSPVQALIGAKANVNAQDSAGRTPLHILVTADTSFKEEATHALLAAGANPNLRDKEGRPPMLAAMMEEWPWNGANESIPLLAAGGADLTMADPHGRTILHYLAAMGDGTQDPIFFARNLVAVLAKAKLDFNAQDQAGDTPLHIAARQGATKVFEWLIAQGAKLAVTNTAGVMPRALALQNANRFRRLQLPPNEDLHEAARRDDVETILRLLQVEPQLLNLTNQTGETSLRLAAKHNQTNVVAALDAAGAVWDEVSAAMLGRVAALQPILSRNPQAANTMAYGRPVLHWAAESGDVPVVELLLAAGAKLDASEHAGTSALGAAIRSNRTEVVALLRRRGGAENLFDCIALDQPELAVALVKQRPALGGMTNGAGLSPVQTAVAWGQTRVLAALLNQQIAAAPRQAQLTPLHVAAVCNRTNEAVLLLQHGADVAALDDCGVQPLHYAAAANASDLLALLLQHGAKPDAPVQAPEPRTPAMLPAGTTALHLAAAGGRTNAIAVLLRAGANVNATNAPGLTPLDLAHYSELPGIGFPSYSPLAMPGTLLRLSLGGIGVRMGQPTPPIVFPPVRQAVIVQLEQAGAQRGKPIRSPATRF